MDKKKKVDEKINLERIYNIQILLIILIGINTIGILLLILNGPILTVEYKNKTCNDNSIVDTSWKLEENKSVNLTSFFYMNYTKPKETIKYPGEDLYCWSTASKPLCKYIELKNGTLIPKGMCFVTYNYIIECVNKSEVVGEVTR